MLIWSRLNQIDIDMPKGLIPQQVLINKGYGVNTWLQVREGRCGMPGAGFGVVSRRFWIVRGSLCMLVELPGSPLSLLGTSNDGALELLRGI